MSGSTPVTGPDGSRIFREAGTGIEYVKELAYGDGHMTEIRKLANLDIQRSIDAVLGQMEPGQKGTVVVYADGDHLRGAVYGRIGSSWSWSGTLARDWDSGKITGAAAIMHKW